MPAKTSENSDGVAAETFARALGLTGDRGRYGPDDFIKLEPSAEADALAEWLAADSLPALRQAQRTGELPFPSSVTVREVGEESGLRAELPIIDPPDSLEAHGHTLGLPLLATLCPQLLELAVEQLIPRRLNPREHPLRETRAWLGFELVTQESYLWFVAEGVLIAAGYQAVNPYGALPYATRVRALRWWWEPQRGRQPRQALCIRCGDIIIVHAWRSRTDAPLCGRCVKKPALELPHAIAPHRRGTWWLRCQTEGCSNAFVGSAQARHCPRHRSAGITPGRRQRNGPAGSA